MTSEAVYACAGENASERVLAAVSVRQRPLAAARLRRAHAACPRRLAHAPHTVLSCLPATLPLLLMFARSSLLAARPRLNATHLSRPTYRPLPQRPLRLRSYASAAQADTSDPLPASRLARYARRSLYTAGAIGALWFLDTEFNASAVTRNLRTFWTVSNILISVLVCGSPLCWSPLSLCADLCTSGGTLVCGAGRRLLFALGTQWRIASRASRKHAVPSTSPDAGCEDHPATRLESSVWLALAPLIHLPDEP